MARKKEWTKTMRGTQLLAPGDLIQLMDQGTVLKCRVLSCLATEDGGCLASVEIIEGARRGEKIRTVLKAGKSEVAEQNEDS